MSTIYPFESFFDKLIKIKAFRDEIKYHYGDKEGAEIIRQIKIGIPPDQIDGFDPVLMEDLVINSGNTVSGFTGLGGYGKFPIDIKQFGPVYWIWALECGETGNFKSQKDAEEAAKNDFETFITDYEEEENRYAD